MASLADLHQREGQRAAAAAPVVETALVVRAPTDTQVTVNSSGSDETVARARNVLLIAGDLALILRQGDRAWAVGKVAGQWHSMTGTVLTVPPGSSTITVEVAGISHVLPFLASYTPVVANVVAILWTADGGVVLGAMGATPAPPPAPAALPSAPAATPGVSRGGTDTFPAVDSSQWRSGKWGASGSRDVYQGDWGYGANSGAWFYGTGPTDWCGTGATVLSARVRLTRRSGGDHGAQSAHLYYHTSRSRPAGDVARTAGPLDVSLNIGETRWVDIPAAWAQAIVTSGGGLGVTGDPYVVLNGIDTDRESGLLEITWLA